MPDVIRECIATFGEAPRSLPLWDRLVYLRVPKPAWLRSRPFDDLTTLFQLAPKLFIEGVVVWGHVVQANQLLFSEGLHNCPGEVVYSLKDGQQASPQYLGEVAHRLFSLKGTTPDRATLAEIADYLAAETVRVFGLSVPQEISPAVRCQISTTYFVRKHLPGRRLCSSLLPIIVNPATPHVALPLPAKYWPHDFVQWWLK